MGDEIIEAVKALLEPKSIRDIQVFLGFANFYRCFIQNFSKIAASLTSMLKTAPTAVTGIPPKVVDDCIFLTLKVKLAFSWLRQAFTKAPILHHFDPEQYIRIEMDASGYAISGILSQLTLEFGPWHPVALFSKEVIPKETWYKTHNQELLAIIETLKTCCYYLKSCQYEFLVLSNHNNLCRFMDTKSLSLRDVRWAQEFSR